MGTIQLFRQIAGTFFPELFGYRKGVFTGADRDQTDMGLLRLRSALNSSRQRIPCHN